jgi:hypothetical protein
MELEMKSLPDDEYDISDICCMYQRQLMKSLLDDEYDTSDICTCQIVARQLMPLYS